MPALIPKNMSFNHAALEKQRAKFLSKYEAIFQDYLDDAFTLFHDVFSATGALDLALGAVRDSDALTYAYDDLFEDVGATFGTKLFTELTGDTSLLKPAALLTGISLAVQQFKAEMVTAVNETTADLLGSFYNATVDPTSNTPAAIQLLRANSAWSLSQVYRAERLSASEVNAASNVGRNEGAKLVVDATEGEVIPGKIWVAQNRPETRPDHDAADGQKAALDQPFTVGGEQLMFPQDRSLGATVKNIVNCRCAAKYLDEKSLTSV